MTSTADVRATEDVTAPARLATADVGLLVLRMVVGLVMAGHGAQKLFGWFGGGGLDGAGKGFAALGYTPGRVFAFVAGASEFAGGLMFAAGLLTPLAAAAIIGVLFNAVAVHWSAGLWGQNGGFEYPLILVAVATTIAFTGPGALALDRGRRWQRGGSLSVAVALGLGFGAGLLTLLVKAL